jgi:outer membrane protein assembly factor BamE (lipoprotein component of BamABCDE complex)
MVARTGICLAGLVALSLAACAPAVNTRGNLVEDQRLSRLAVGQTTAQEVANLLGTPTTVATFDERTWYYIGQRTEQRAFFDPNIVERRILKIRFDRAGVIESVEEYGPDDALEVELVERETPSLGRRMSFLEQMIGNLGRFNPAAGEEQ